jgi:hypothetical protein
MVAHRLRIVVEKVNVITEKVVERNEISSFDMLAPKNIIGLGLRHTEQINLLQSIQDCILAEQSILLKEEQECCPKCNSKIWSNGYKTSEFHAIFTDHKVKIRKQKCSSHDCDWHSIHTVKSLLGTSVHPDLYKLQCEYGATQSFRKSEEILTSLSNSKREVNNRERISNISNQVGKELDNRQKLPAITLDKNNPAKELIVQVDGGHIHDKDLEKRSFEAMCAKVYRPESVIEITEKRTEIVNKNCVASAKDDKQATMKKLLLRATTAQGLTLETTVTALADGANNCWSIINSLEKHCAQLHRVLDWFHLGKKFQNVIQGINSEYSKDLVEIKALFWHGQVTEGITMLQQLKNKVEIKEEKTKVNGLLIYLNGNKEYIINYGKQAMERKPYTSQVAESTVEHLINDRHKKNQKMQWTREGAHNILQIRASLASNEWDYIWQEAILGALGIAA